jgi:hypothetical protein
LALWAALLALVSAGRGYGQSASLTIPADPAGLTAALKKFSASQFTLQKLAPVERAGELELGVWLAGNPHQIVLQKHSLRAPGFRVQAQDGNGLLHDVAVPESQTYRGYVAGCGGSSVTASITDGQVRACVRLSGSDDTTWIVEPLPGILPAAADGQHVVYRSESLAGEAGVCGNADVPANQPPSAPPVNSPAAMLDVLVCRIACDADYEYYTLNGSSVSNTILDIETVLNGVSAIYERDTRVAFQLTHILVRAAEPDPYTSTTANGILSDFRLDWRSNHQDIPRDVAHLFTGKNFGTVLGISYTDQVCPAYEHYSVARSRWQTDLGKRIALSAHEIGHSFDAVHCDYDSDPRCRIMCPSIGGCSVGYYSFEDSNVARIRARAARAVCLTAGTVTTPTTTLPFVDNFDTINYPPQPPNPAKWTAVDLAQCEYRRLVIKIGRGYNYNQTLGTVRTLPMQLGGAALVRYQVNHNGMPSSQSFKIEYLNSSTFTWQTLRTLVGDGSTQYQAYEDTVPATAAGDYFALRFSAWGTAYTSSYISWSVEDVSITPIVVAPRLAIARTATNTVVLSWPQAAPNWSLETSPVLAPAAGGWTLISPPYPTNATHCVVTLPVPPGNKFFRLRAP